MSEYKFAIRIYSGNPGMLWAAEKSVCGKGRIENLRQDEFNGASTADDVLVDGVVRWP